MTSASTDVKVCPLCAETIKAEAKVCRFCGAHFQVTRNGYCSTCHEVVSLNGGAACPVCEVAISDVFYTSLLVTDEPLGAEGPAPVAPGPAAPVGKVREGIVGRPRHRVGSRLQSIAGGLVILVTLAFYVLGRDVAWLRWGDEAPGPLEPSYVSHVYHGPGPIYLVGALAIVVVGSWSIRALLPRIRGRGAVRAVSEWKRRLREEHGITELLARRGLKAGAVTCGLLWVGLLAWSLVAWQELAGRPAVTVQPGIFVMTLVTAAGLVGTLLVWPTSADEVVAVDEEGTLHR